MLSDVFHWDTTFLHFLTKCIDISFFIPYTVTTVQAMKRNSTHVQTWKRVPVCWEGNHELAVEHVLELQMRNNSSVCRLIPLPIKVMLPWRWAWSSLTEVSFRKELINCCLLYTSNHECFRRILSAKCSIHSFCHTASHLPLFTGIYLVKCTPLQYSFTVLGLLLFNPSAAS